MTRSTHKRRCNRLFGGVVLMLMGIFAAREAHAEWPIDTLHKFTSGTEGDLLWGGLLIDSKGYIYGTDTTAGTKGYGSVFRLNPPAKGGTWTVSVLHAFTGGSDGSYPFASLVADPSGNLYGITLGPTVTGSVFKLSPPAKGEPHWVLTPLHNFTGGADGGSPMGDLIRDEAGALYGTTYYGGHGCNTSGCGVVFRMTPPAKGQTRWTPAVLYEFCRQANCTDGGNPDGGLVRDAHGVLYGMTSLGGDYGPSGDGCYCGVVYSLTPPAKGKTAWTYRVLHTFLGNYYKNIDGANPNASLILDSSGALYGTTVLGGSFFEGTAFKLTPSTGGKNVWTETALHEFGSGDDGQIPHGSLIFDTKGALYGTTLDSGLHGGGMVFKLNPPDRGTHVWTEQHLFDFSSGANGDGPNASLTFGPGNALFGTTSGSRSNDGGTVFKLTPP
jgi:uncharacterized repeat protein (TIGR03803 family)